jgi:type III pantothenate kinase
MLLVVDVGNTNTVLGLFEGDHLLHTWRISTTQRTTDEFGLIVLQLLNHQGIPAGAVHGVAIGTVVPAVLYAMEKASRRYLNATARVVDPRTTQAIPLKVDNPSEVGADRVINAVAALAKHAPPLLVVDFGTATTFDAVDASGAYVGGAIAPGFQISADALFTRTSRLPRVEVQRPRHAIGCNTVHAMQSGLFWCYVGLVDGLARRCKAELQVGDTPVRCIATGGLSNLVGRACVEIDEVDEALTLHGLRLCFDREG